MENIDRLHRKVDELEIMMQELIDIVHMRIAQVDSDRHIREDILGAGLSALEKKMKKLIAAEVATKQDSNAVWNLINERINALEEILVKKIESLEKKLGL